MTKRIASLAFVAAAFVAVALPAAPASAEICIWEEPTIGWRLCI